MIKNKKKVLVAMSGGVDSSVAAAILKSRGYDVVGVFMHFWRDRSITRNNDISKTNKQLKNICKKIGIPLHIVNAEKEFKKKVVNYFLSEYQKGRTPNPCIICNREIKFKILFEKMLEFKADYVATGHYASIKITGNKINKRYILCEAKDQSKDQSYFLYTLNQKYLSHILFPIDNCYKSEVRKMAKKLKLPNINKKESQDVCFIKSSVKDFLNKQIRLKTGVIVDETGKMLGKHQGLPLYTLGQRKGINIGGDGPYYVSCKDISKNKLIVTNNPSEGLLYSKLIKVENINWISNKLSKGAIISVRTRYHNPVFSAIIKSIKGKTGWIHINEYQKGITPGQSAVFYKGKKILGGGVIRKIK